jgi:TonB-dependent SusC/RagA subfamily outer membrane receptor
MSDRLPMYFLDGERVVIDSSACATPPPGVRLVTDLSAHAIDSIQVLPREEAAALYGPEAADGVVLITTHGQKP